MGGMGSGNWYRWSKKTTTEEAYRVDIRYLRKQGMLVPGCSGNLWWSQGGEPSGSVSYRVERYRLVLRYRYRAPCEDWQDAEEFVWFDRTPCHFGGERLWFSCPHCGRRVALLYFTGARFLCRHCCDLSYASQNEDWIDRMNRKAQKLRQRLGATDDLGLPVWKKPKGMHWKTFERLLHEEQEATDAWTLGMVGKLQQMGWHDLV